MIDGLLQLDARVLVWVTTHRIAVLDTPMWLLSVIGRGGIVWIAIGVALVVAKRISLRGFLRLALAVLLAIVVADRVIKPIVGLARPFDHLAGVHVIGGRTDDASFPS